MSDAKLIGSVDKKVSFLAIFGLSLYEAIKRSIAVGSARALDPLGVAPEVAAIVGFVAVSYVMLIGWILWLTKDR